MIGATQTPAPGSGSTPNPPQMPARGAQTTQLCIPNIDTFQRRRRLAFGLVELALGLAILAALMAFGVDRWWRLLLVLVFSGAASGFFQWRDHT